MSTALNTPVESKSTDNTIPPHIARELVRIQDALLDAGTDAERWGLLYVAQQALVWAFHVDLAAAPFAVIVDGKVQPPEANKKARAPLGARRDFIGP